MPFITKINFQDNRQHRLPTRQSQDLSGTTVFGVPFSAMTAGPDPSDSGTTGSIINIVSTFSGNTGTTVFSFGHPAMDIAQGAFSALTLANSADTQDSGNIFVGNTSQTVDGNLSYLDYTGTSFEFEVTAITETSPGVFTGSGISDDVLWLSAGTLDYTGRTIWSDVQGIHRTQKLIVSEGAVVGYALVASSLDGDLVYAPMSGASGGTDTFVTGSTLIPSASTIRLTRNDAVNIDTDITPLISWFTTGTTLFEEGGTGNNSIKDIKGGHSMVGAADYSMIAGGAGHLNETSDYNFMGGGTGNTITGSAGSSAAIGGLGNQVQGKYSAIVVGTGHTSSGNFTYIGGGQDHLIANAPYSTILGGHDNRIGSNNTDTSAILGGVGHIINGSSGFSNRNVIAGGSGHTINGRVDDNFIGGGQGHSIVSRYTAIVGGRDNTNTGQDSLIGGGYNNTLSGNKSALLGGENNQTQNAWTGIIAGLNNWITGGTSTYSTIMGGTGNEIIGSKNATIIAGTGNTITSADNSVILGGQNITATTNDMVYVPDLVIDGLTSTDPIATDANGKIVAGASDRRLKQNITDLSGGLDKIKNLRGVSYEWTEESNMGEGLRYGLIAQEVQEVIPDMVRERAKGDGMLTLNYNEVVPWLIEAVKEMSADEYFNTRLETQTIVAEDNSIELNFGGTHATAQGGGISVKDGIREGADSFIKIDETGRWIIGPALTTAQLTLPEYTPESYQDEIGSSGDVVWDDRYLYIKTNYGWRRTGLETF